eukprot:6256071-Prymnesium_polylepis.1
MHEIALQRDRAGRCIGPGHCGSRVRRAGGQISGQRGGVERVPCGVHVPWRSRARVRRGRACDEPRGENKNFREVRYKMRNTRPTRSSGTRAPGSAGTARTNM